MGRPTTRQSILNLLNNKLYPISAQDVGSAIGMSSKSASKHLAILKSKGLVKSKAPLFHLGERGATLYWIGDENGL